MKGLIIINAGNFGREVLSWAKQTNEYNNDWYIKGFLDSRHNILDSFDYNEKILGSAENYIPEENDLFVCAIGNPTVKKEICDIIEKNGGIFTNIIHKSVIIGNNVNIGKGVIICPNTVLSCDIHIGNHTAINILCSIGHDVFIGNHCQLSSHINLTGKVKIMNEVLINSNACILPEITINERATIGAGSVVLKNVEVGEKVFGNPARVIAK